MKKLFFLLLVFIFIPLSVGALTTGSSYTDSIGYTHYNFSDGTSGTSMVDDTGRVNFRLNDGTYGSAYLDSVGTLHYYFDNNFTNKQNTVVYGKCRMTYNFTCTNESQYQEMYNNALQGLPSCSSSSGESGSFSVPTEYCTPEGREQLIMNGSYGPWLKMCRDSINLYNQMQASYDKCVQEETDKYLAYVKQKLDYLAQQAKSEMELQKDLACLRLGALSFDDSIGQCKCFSGKYFDTTLNKCISECPENSTKVSGGCLCNIGFVYHNKTGNKCVRCESVIANFHYDSTVRNCACNSGYNYNVINDICDPVVNNVNTNNPEKNTTKQEVKKVIPPSSNISNIVPVKKEIGSVITPESNELTGSSTKLDISNKDNQSNNENKTNNESKIVNIFRNFGSAIKGFFKKLKFW